MSYQISVTNYLFSAVILLASSTNFASERQAAETSLDTVDKVNLVALFGIELHASHVLFKVMSNGCTSDKHFETLLVSSGRSLELGIERTKRDRCRRKPKLIQITKELDYSGLAPNLPIMLVNPLQIHTR